MNCQQFRRSLADLTARQLALLPNRKANQHLTDCPACRRFRQTYQQTVALAGQLPDDSLPQGLLAKFLRAQARTQRE